MARPKTRPINLKDGFYIEVRNPGSGSGVLIRRKSMTEVENTIQIYRKSKDVSFVGEVRDGKFLDSK